MTADAYEDIEYSVEGHVATITLARPEIGNALGDRLRSELDRVMDSLETSDQIRAVVVRGLGNNFCVGYDLSKRPYLFKTAAELTGGPDEAGNFDRRAGTPSWTRRGIQLSKDRWQRLRNVRQVTIGAVHGHCAAGGTDLIGALDIVFAAEDARIGHPQNRLMGMAHTQGMYPLFLGIRQAKEWLFTGDWMTGAEAAEYGLVNRAVPLEDLNGVAYAYANRVALVPLDLLHAHKDGVHRWYEAMGIAAALSAAADLDAIGLGGPSNGLFRDVARRDGLKAAFAYRDGPFQEHRTYWEAFQANRAQTRSTRH